MFLSGQLLELVGEHPSNEHWWEVRNEEGDRGFVPSSYVLIKKDQVWKHQENFSNRIQNLVIIFAYAAVPPTARYIEHYSVAYFKSSHVQCSC